MSETQNNTTLSQKEALAGIRWNEAGLVPAVVQDASSLEVLMVAYMNSESLQLSLESGQTWFWSRSRSELWHKGGTSGNTQAITSISYDCDSDTLLVKVVPEGPACHTGATSCFFREIPLNNPTTDASKPVSSLTDGERFAVLGELERVIAEREVERPEGAYTTYLFDKGVDKILKKVGEEASETIIAAKNKDNAELRLEVSDLIYHLLVLLQERKLPLDEIMEELSTRHERPRRDQY
ncbi:MULTISPECIES: bifunctional phosphoribosyl-AMP cyclohydrolase/phosphoribosyl-ATP diphosphatase HisIE [Paenibacillus]|uniref:bifunctional phosphoribosyl-AMP cyclohydrolase/phosphoribosyl-ATP diphosphatase HisIE n=1 Tax=Paenibacillus TaxID=44249 RepID=UPI00096D33F5|nr:MULTISPECIES: bifunctional phosphoribosyl-AMP cyclohydrolase/phosphoribosyl-ATP diphosphatase HisIE [Paenibacillus]MDH6429608.1 phosphoribosyl-ATP pyrophosphohydrolase/phosphoribosyl-AMP cyclohydrolase [Paenibacillus sp. PastH-4]MDH6445816.1 phosphoribosyl-ATP pyrophosphohydrolase/phosphoribosyl-AMP cyclohydrolase [Paenibacillus sp. PastF-4]MDH6529703.1 phosphoribosyl-ATP pyrophosphohydrolase/phosphoribosyl-AMP cyclohydrolase [Paenibacillus sp. PastH-3]OMC77161.1 bifunctional phosphoribosyl-